MHSVKSILDALLKEIRNKSPEEGAALRLQRKILNFLGLQQVQCLFNTKNVSASELNTVFAALITMSASSLKLPLDYFGYKMKTGSESETPEGSQVHCGK